MAPETQSRTSCSSAAQLTGVPVNTFGKCIDSLPLLFCDKKKKVTVAFSCKSEFVFLGHVWPRITCFSHFEVRAVLCLCWGHTCTTSNPNDSEVTRVTPALQDLLGKGPKISEQLLTGWEGHSECGEAQGRALGVPEVEMCVRVLEAKKKKKKKEKRWRPLL